MLESTAKDFDIDISQSLLIGDKPWNIECGEILVVKSYYVQEVIK